MTRTLRLVLLLLTLSLFGLAVSGQVIYTRLSYLWILLILANLLLARVSLGDIEFHRYARAQRLHVGDIFEEVFEVLNHARLPRLWLEIEDASKIPGASGSRVLTLIGGGRTRSYASRTHLIARGVYALGPTRLNSGDLLGLFSVSKEQPANGYLTVYPRVEKFAELATPAGLMPGGEAVRRRTHQITPNAASVREYVHGDPMNRIHWTSTARRSRLMVKDFELDPLAEVWIFVDGEEGVQAALPFKLETDPGSVIFDTQTEPRILPTTEEYAVSLAASLADHFLQAGRAVAFAAAGRGLEVLPTDRGGRQWNKIMESLALFKAEGEMRFAGLVLNHARYLPRGSTLFLVTPSVRPDILPLIDQLRLLGLRPLLLLLDAGSFGGEPGSQALTAKLATLNVPSVLVAVDDDLPRAIQELNRRVNNPGGFN
jgi:uncharacterized protein (DUF58 family)